MSRRATVHVRQRYSPILKREIVEEPGLLTFAEGEIPNDSRVLRDFSPMDEPFGAFYDHMEETWPDLPGLYRKAFRPVLAARRRLVRADDSPLARDVWQLTKDAVAGLVPTSEGPGAYRSFGFGGLLEALLEANKRGVAFVELVWEELRRGPLAGAWLPVAAIPRGMHHFAFKRVKRGRGHRVVLCVRRLGELVPVPPGKILTLRHGVTDSPWGKAQYDHLARTLWQSYVAEMYYVLRHDERWGDPVPGTSYDLQEGTSDDVRQENADREKAAMKLAEGLYGNASLAYSKLFEPGLIHPSVAGSAHYHQTLQMLRQQASLYILGEVNTSGLRPGVGAFASEKVSKDIHDEGTDLQAHDLCAYLTDTLLRFIAELNFGPGASRARLVIAKSKRRSEETRENLKLMRELGVDLEISTRELREAFGFAEPEPGDEVINFGRSSGGGEGNDS